MSAEANERVTCGNRPCDLHAEPYTGQHTNGGCHCLDGLPPELRRRVRIAVRHAYAAGRRVGLEEAAVLAQRRAVGEDDLAEKEPT